MCPTKPPQIYAALGTKKGKYIIKMLAVDRDQAGSDKW
jgi:hypothetical protein